MSVASIHNSDSLSEGIGGHPHQMTEDKISAVRELLASGMPVKDAAAAVGVSVPTLYRWLPGEHGDRRLQQQ